MFCLSWLILRLCLGYLSVICGLCFDYPLVVSWLYFGYPWVVSFVSCFCAENALFAYFLPLLACFGLCVGYLSVMFRLSWVMWSYLVVMSFSV